MSYILESLGLTREDCLSLPRTEQINSKGGRPHRRIVCSAGTWSMAFESVKDACKRGFDKGCIYQAIRRGTRHCGRRWNYA